MITVGLDSNKLNAQIAEFIRQTGREAGKVLKAQARLLVRDLIAATPPFGKAAFSRDVESYNDQRAIGRKAVERDIRKVFVSLRDYIKELDNVKLAAALTQAGGLGASSNIKTRKQSFRKSSVDMPALEAIFRNMGKEGRVIMEVNADLHKKARNRRGRTVGGKSNRYVVVRERSLDKYISEVQRRVGYAKAGWMKAAIALGVKGIPNWIKQHVTAGVFEDRTNASNMSVTVGNLVEFQEDFDRRQFQAALKNREIAIPIEMRKIVEGEARKRGAKVT
jgi:hypothetical protein